MRYQNIYIIFMFIFISIQNCRYTKLTTVDG